MASSDFLSRIIEKKRERLAEAKSSRTLEEVRSVAQCARDGAQPHAFLAALESRGRVRIIAEFKRASPSRGEIRAGAFACETAREYERGGAAAISVLTEQDFFKGSLEDLAEVKACASLPILRKDFIFDEYQVFESAAAGADALLLILAALEDETLGRLLRITEELGMDALVEVHTLAEMLRAVGAGARIIGVNNRDLGTFEVSLETSIGLARHAPSGALLVSESGIRDSQDIARLRACGFGAFLIGETLMRAGQAADTLRALISYDAETRGAR